MEKEPDVVIREVWESNLDHEFALIASLIHQYPFVSMDTEFPGVIFRSHNKDYCRLSPQENYKLLKYNVDALSLVQVGLTLSDKHGNLPTDAAKNGYIWQFNFRDFNVARDLHDRASVALLRHQGIDFERNAAEGVPSRRFARLAAASGLLFNGGVTWVTFHGAYDFGYLVKVMTRRPLPNRLEEFVWMVRAMFGERVYDVKHVMRFCDGLYGGLERVSNTLNLGRVAGKCHQAGSDSLLTTHVFVEINRIYFGDDDHCSIRKHANVLFGLHIRPLYS